MPKNIRRTGIAGKQSFQRDVERFRAALTTSGGAGTGSNHGTLIGLDDDDHSQYAHLAQAEIVIGQYTFQPASAQPPFLLHVNAQGQLVTGFNADMLEGLEPSSNPGAAAAILASDASGYVRVERIGFGVAPTANVHIRDATQPQLRVEYDLNDYMTFGIDSVADATLQLVSSGSGGSLTFDVEGSIFFDPLGNQVNPVNNYDVNLGQLSKKYLTLHAAELWVETLVAQDTIATIGGRILVGPTTTLTSDLASGATTMYVKHNQMILADRVYMEADGKVEFMRITSAPGGAGPYSYTVVRNLDGSGANNWYAGDAVFNTGQAGNGFIDLYSIAGVNPGSTLGPTIVGNVRNSLTYNDWTEHWAIGNLKGLYGYGSDTYGVGFGKYQDDWITVDSVNGIRLNNNNILTGQWLTNGDLILGRVVANKGNLFWDDSDGALNFRSNVTTMMKFDTVWGATNRASFQMGENVASANTTGFLVNAGTSGAGATTWNNTARGFVVINAGGNNITVNSQTVSAGDILIGNNSSSKANIFFDYSVGRLNFRGGLTTQAYIDTDGTIAAGAGAVRLGTSGIEFKANSAEIPSGASVNSIDWYDTAFSSLYAWVEASHDTITSNWNRLQLQVEPYGTSGDAYIALLSTGLNVTRIEMFADLVRIDDLLFINESINSKQTQGITIRQSTSGAGYEVLTFKDDDVTHAMTSITETDSYGMMRGLGNTVGGLAIRGLTEATRSLIFGGFSVSENTLTSASASGGIEFNTALRSGVGPNLTALGNTGNLFVVQNNGGARFLVKGNGDLKMDGTPGSGGDWDDYDDVALLTGLRALVAPNLRTRLETNFRDFVDYARPILEESDIVTVNDGQYGNDDDGSIFVSAQGLAYLTMDAVRQLHQKMNLMEAALLEAGIEVPQLHGGSR